MLPGKAYKAAGQSEPILGYRTDDKEMVVYGLLIDRIKMLAPLAHADLPAIQAMNETQLMNMARDYMMMYACLYMSSRDADFHGLLQGRWPGEWLDMAFAIRWEEPYITGQTYAEAYWRTLIGDMDPYALAHVFNRRAPTDLSISHMADIWLEQSALPADFDPQEPNMKVRRAQFFYPVSARAQAMTLGKHVYLTATGLIGLGTHNAEEGDIVVVLPGSQVPMLLRKREHEEYYTLIGETYVHGYMDGKAMTMLDGEEGLIEFNIR